MISLDELVAFVRAAFAQKKFRLGFVMFLVGCLSMLLLAVLEAAALPEWVYSDVPWIAVAVSGVGVMLMVKSKPKAP